MPSVSSLLKSAEAARRRQRQSQEEAVAFQWQNSAKTPEDWNWYEDFLKEQQKSAGPTESLSYAKKLKSAEDSFVGAEIQRENIRIQNGTGTTQTKYDAVYTLYERALERGNYDLAQNLIYQLGSLRDKILREGESAQRVAATMANNKVKDLGDLTTAFYKNEDFIELGDGTLVKPLKMIEREFATTGNPFVFDDLKTTLQVLQSTVYDAYKSATTTEAQQTIADRYGDIIEGTKSFRMGGIEFTYPEAVEMADSARANNPIYSPEIVTRKVVDKDGKVALVAELKLKKNKVDDFVWTVDEDGEYGITEIRTKTKGQSLDMEVSEAGPIKMFIEDGKKVYKVYNPATQEYDKVDRDKAENISVQSRLEAMGYTVGEMTDGKFELTTPEGIYIDQATVMPDGSVRFISVPGKYSGKSAGLYEIDVISGNTREVAPDETSDFGVMSEFGGLSSRASNAGMRIIKSLSGLHRSTLPKAVDLSTSPDDFRVKDFNPGTIGAFGYTDGYGIPATTGLLQSASATQLRRAELERQAKLTSQSILQPSQAYGLNQTPVRQTAQNDEPVDQLKVWTPAEHTRPTVTVIPSKPRTATVTNSSGTQGGFGNYSGPLRVR